jgi:hypothetical protein
MRTEFRASRCEQSRRSSNQRHEQDGCATSRLRSLVVDVRARRAEQGRSRVPETTIIYTVGNASPAYEPLYTKGNAIAALENATTPITAAPAVAFRRSSENAALGHQDGAACTA